MFIVVLNYMLFTRDSKDLPNNLSENWSTRSHS